MPSKHISVVSIFCFIVCFELQKPCKDITFSFINQRNVTKNKVGVIDLFVCMRDNSYFCNRKSVETSNNSFYKYFICKLLNLVVLVCISRGEDDVMSSSYFPQKKKNE